MATTPPSRSDDDGKDMNSANGYTDRERDRERRRDRGRSRRGGDRYDRDTPRRDRNAGGGRRDRERYDRRERGNRSNRRERERADRSYRQRSRSRSRDRERDRDRRDMDRSRDRRDRDRDRDRDSQSHRGGRTDDEYAVVRSRSSGRPRGQPEPFAPHMQRQPSTQQPSIYNSPRSADSPGPDAFDNPITQQPPPVNGMMYRNGSGSNAAATSPTTAGASSFHHLQQGAPLRVPANSSLAAISQAVPGAGAVPNGATSPNAKALLAAAKVLQGKSSEEEEKKLRRMSLKDEVRRLIIKQKAMKKLNKKTSASIKESPSVSDEDAMAAASSPKVGIFARQNSFSRLSNKSNSKGANNKFSSRRRDSRMMSVVGYNGESAHHRRPTMEILDETKEVALTTQQKLSMLVEHPVVTTLILLVTILAISLLFLQLFDVQQAQNDETRNNIAIYWIEWAILIFFTVEVVVRFIAMGADYLKDFLCLMDLAVSIVDWATVLLSTTGLDAFVFLRVLRVLRLTKVTRMARLSTYYNQNEDNFHEDETGRIYSYNADHLFSVGYATRFAGTVFSQIEVWIQYMFLVILTTSWALIICPENCDDSTYTAVDDECDNCVNGFDAGSALTVSVVVAFMVSTFLNETSTRWWGIRKTTDRLFTEVFCCSLKLMCWIPKSSSRSLRFRDNLMRYANLGIELTILAARKSKLLVSMNIDDFLQRGLLNQVEADRMCNMELIEAIDYIYSLPLYQINHHGFQGCAIVPRHQLHELFFKQAEISRDLLMRILTPMPFPYAHLMAIIVKLHLLLVSAMAGTYVGRGFKQQQPGYVFWGYMILLFANIVFEGLLRLHVTLHNPFGDGVADLPVAMYLQENLKSTVGMLETEKNLPFQFTPYTKGKSERGEKKAGRKSSGEKRGEGGLSMSDIALLTSDDDLSDHQL